MTETGDTFRALEDSWLEDATMPFGKYKGKKILEVDDEDYWRWVWNTDDVYKKLGKYQKKAVRCAAG